MASAAVREQNNARVKDIAFCGLAIALMAVGAWVTVPLGPVPFTLQSFVVMLVVLTLTPKQAIAAVCGYVALGAIGLPVFSGMKGGLGVILGPTGGFLWGFIIGAIAALMVMMAVRKIGISGVKGQLVADIAAAVVFMFVLYACGVVQLSTLAGFTLAEAFAVGVAPFIVIDAAKYVAAIVIGQAVKAALNGNE